MAIALTMHTPIANMVAEMMDRGADRDVILLAVRTAEECLIASQPVGRGDASAEKRRAYDRERKKKKRDDENAASGGKSAEGNSCNIPRKSGGSPVESPRTQETPLTLTSSPHIQTTEEVKKVRARKPSAVPLPAEWKPNAEHFEKAIQRGIPPAGVESKAEDMRIWAGSTGARKVDWDLTFHGFIRRDAVKLAETYGKPNGKPQSSLMSAIDEHIAAFERGSGEVRENPPRLLPHG